MALEVVGRWSPAMQQPLKALLSSLHQGRKRILPRGNYHLLFGKSLLHSPSIFQFPFICFILYSLYVIYPILSRALEIFFPLIKLLFVNMEEKSGKLLAPRCMQYFYWLSCRQTVGCCLSNGQKCPLGHTWLIPLRSTSIPLPLWVSLQPQVSRYPAIFNVVLEHFLNIFVSPRFRGKQEPPRT